jgi:DNA-binding NtrC family response regulator
VIEDDIDVLETVGRVLEEAGYTPILTADGREGMIAFESHSPSLVITDLFMPVREGIEIIMEMRRSRPDAKIIAMSGGGRMGAMEYLEVAEKLGATAALPKPFEPDDLVGAVVRLLPGQTPLSCG